jgi:hypothetical protein
LAVITKLQLITPQAFNIQRDDVRQFQFGHENNLQQCDSTQFSFVRIARSQGALELLAGNASVENVDGATFLDGESEHVLLPKLLPKSQIVATQKRKSRCKSMNCNGSRILAEWTGLEPATPGVTGRYSNQLNYHSW